MALLHRFKWNASRPSHATALERTRLQVLAGALALLVGSTCASAQPAPSADNRPPSRITHALLVTDEWHDLTRKDGSGLYLELVRTVFARQGVQVEFGFYPYARAVQRVKDQQADGWVASFLNEKNFPLYPKFHFDKNEQTILYLKHKQQKPVTTASLRNQRVAWLRDFGLDRYIREPMRIHEIDSIESAFFMLASDRIDYFIGARSDIEDYIRQAKQDMTNFEMAHATYLGLYLAFANTPRGEQLRTLWDTEMQRFHTDPAFKAIYRKYGYAYPFP